MSSPTTLLVDADVLFHKFAYNNEFTTEWEPGVVEVVVDEHTAKMQMDNFIDYLIHTTECREAILCMSARNNFRYDVMPTYKHNRSGKVAPALHSILKDYAANHPRYPSCLMNHLEADDVMGIISTEEPNTCVIATIDKDLMQIPGYHFNWNKDKWLQYVEPADGDKFFYRQILTGDTVDGYTGCPQVGPKKADEIIESVPNPGSPKWHREMWELIVEEYECCEWIYAYETFLVDELTEEHALTEARVARMLRAGEYDHKKEEPILWTPPNRQ